MKDLAARLSHTGFARFLQGMNYSAGLLRHERELQQVYDMLADELSRETFRVVISTCKSGDYSGMHKYNVQPQYFLKDICVPLSREIYVDGGGV